MTTGETGMAQDQPAGSEAPGSLGPRSRRFTAIIAVVVLAVAILRIAKIMRSQPSDEETPWVRRLALARGRVLGVLPTSIATCERTAQIDTLHDRTPWGGVVSYPRRRVDMMPDPGHREVLPVAIAQDEVIRRWR